MDKDKLQSIIDVTQNTINTGIKLIKLKQKELHTIYKFRQTKTVRTKRRRLQSEIKLLQEKMRDKYEQLQLVKNKRDDIQSNSADIV